MGTWPLNIVGVRKYQVDENMPQKSAKISGGWKHGTEICENIRWMRTCPGICENIRWMETWPRNLRKDQVDENMAQKSAKISGGWKHGP
jgi:hypothetical protein